MRVLRHVAIAAALLGSTAIVPAQTVTTTTTTVERTTTPLQLRPEQRSTIYRTVTRERRAAPVAVEVDVGARVPQTVTLSEFPSTLYVEQPELRRLRYYHVNNQLVLVDPATSQVVEIIQD